MKWMQVRGTMNWSCPECFDWFHGGLQFQIEHHLFPRMPRHNLRKASKLVKPACERVGLIYHSPTFFEVKCSYPSRARSPLVSEDKPCKLLAIDKSLHHMSKIKVLQESQDLWFIKASVALERRASQKQLLPCQANELVAGSCGDFAVPAWCSSESSYSSCKVQRRCKE